MQKQTRGVEKNGVTGQEREETPEKHGYRQQNGGRESSVAASSQDHVLGPRAGRVRRSAAPAPPQASCKDRGYVPGG